MRFALSNMAGWIVMSWALSLGTAPTAAQEQDPGLQQYATAVGLHNRELYDLAADEWEKFVKNYPKHDRAGHGYHYLGICYYKTKQYDKAQTALQTVVTSYPKFEKLEDTYYFLGLSQIEVAKQNKMPEAYNRAAGTLTTLLQKYANSKHAASALYYRGDCKYHAGKKVEALADYEQVVKSYASDPIAADALYAHGVTAEEITRLETAAASYAAFLTNHGKHPLATEVGMRYGETLFQRKQFAEAEKYFAAAAASREFALADHAALRQAACLASQQKFAEAAALFAAIPGKFPNSPRAALAWVEAGKFYYQAGKLAEARDALAKVQNAGGETGLEAAHWLARCYLKEQKPAEALNVVSAALPKAGESSTAPMLLFDQADALFDMPERRKESVAVYAEFARRFPQDAAAPQAAYMAGFAALNVGNFAAAAQYSEKFLAQYANHDLAPDVLFVAAESQLQLKQYDKASQNFQALLTKYPRRPDAEQWKVRAGLSLYLQKKYPETIAALQPHLNSLKTPALVAEAQFLIGSAHKELRQYREAAAALQAALQASSDWRQADETLLALAVCQRQLGNAAAAVESLKQLVQSFPKSKLVENANYLWGDYAYDQKDYKTALAQYRKVIEGWPLGELALHARLGMGWAQLGLGDASSAERELTALVDSAAGKPLALSARYPRGLARHQLKRYAEGADDLAAFLQTDPPAVERADARYVLGLCLVGQKKLPEAVATFQQIMAEHPTYAGTDKVRYEIAWALKEQGKAAEAVGLFRELVEKHPTSPLSAHGLFHVAEAAYAKGDFKEAARQYFDAEQRASEFGKNGKLLPAEVRQIGENAAHKLAWCYYRQEQFDQAEKTFAYQLKSYAEGTLAEDARFMLGECLFKQKKYAEALKQFDALKSPSTMEFSALALLHAAQAANQLGQHEDALKRLANVAQRLEKSPLLPEALYEQGWALQNLGRLDDALAAYEAVTAKTNEEVAAKARFMIGEVYFEKKEHKEAVKNFFKAAYGYSYPVWQANAHYEAARCFEVLGNLDQAKKSYKEIVEKYPQSDKVAQARQRLAALGE